MNNILRKTLLIALLSCQALSVPGQSPDSTFTSYDWIKPSVVSAKQSILREQGDTSFFNPASVMLHDGATIDALFLEIPGLSIDVKGNVSVSGRPVRELLVEGRRYFGTDVATGLRNIPAACIGGIKVYEKDSDVGLISGVDQSDKAMVIDLSLRQYYKNRLNNSLKTALGWNRKYDGKYNGTLVSQQGIYSAIAGSDNLGALQKSSGTSIRNGLGDNYGKRQSEAGVNGSFSTQKTEINASLLYKSTGNNVLYNGHDDYYRTSGYHYAKNGGRTDERNHSVNAQSTIEWKERNAVRIMLKPQITFTRKETADSLYGESFKGDSLKPYYMSLRRSEGGRTAVRAGTSFIFSKRLSPKGRTLALNLDAWYDLEDQYLRASTDGRISIRNRSIISWRDRESHLHTDGVDARAQLIYNEPLSRNISVQFTGKQTWQADFFNRENTIYDTDIPQKDDNQCAQGRYDYLSGDLSATCRWIITNMNITAGLSVIPVYSRFRSLQNGAPSDTTSLRLNISPRIIWNWNIRENNSLKFIYKGYAKRPSASQILPIASNTNPMYIQNPNPGLRPSFTQEMMLTWKVSDASGARGLSMGGNFKYVKDAFSNKIENNTESSGRIVTPVNVDGNLAAGLDVSAYLATGDFLFNGHFNYDYSTKHLYLFDDVEKASVPGTVRTGSLKQTLVATYRIKRFEANAILEGELTENKLDLRPDLDIAPWILSAGASATWQAEGGWTVSADARYYINRGFAFDMMNRNHIIVNAKISKSFFHGKVVLQADARDLLRSWQNGVLTMTSDKRVLKIYEGDASYIIGRIMLIL